MNEYKISLSEAGTTGWLRLDARGVNLHIYTILVEYSSANSATATVEFAIERDLDNATAICHPVLKDLRDTTSSTFQAPMTGVRLDVGDYMSGTITLKVLQS